MTKDTLFSLTVQAPSEETYKKAKERWDRIAKPIDGLGRLEELICRIAAVQGTVNPDITRKAMLLMCADNGVVSEGVSQTGQQVTADVAALMGQQKSAVGRMAEGYPIDFLVFDVGIHTDRKMPGVIDKKTCRGTADFVKEPAMTEADCLAAIQTGMEAVMQCKEDGYGLIATGEMGIGNTTTSTALLCALLGLAPEDCTGRGAGLSDLGLERKIEVITQGLKRHRGARAASAIQTKEEAFSALCNLGGFDIAALVGVFLGGAIRHVPVVIDGLISAVSALCAEKLLPGAKAFMIASHRGREQAMDDALKTLELSAVLHADLALGEGTGALLLLPMLDMAMSLYRSGTAFLDTKITQYERLTP